MIKRFKWKISKKWPAIAVTFSIFTICFAVNDSTSSITVFLLNSEMQSPIGNDETSFWKKSFDFDTILIKGHYAPEVLNSDLARLSITKTSRFDIRVAIVIDSKFSIDTVYSDQFFNYFKKGEKYYIDKSGSIKKYLSRFARY